MSLEVVSQFLTQNQLQKSVIRQVLVYLRRMKRRPNRRCFHIKLCYLSWRSERGSSTACSKLTQVRCPASVFLNGLSESRSLQQLSLQLSTQSQAILQRVQTFSGSELSNTQPLVASNPLPSHEQWLQSSFNEWNSV